MNKLCNVMLGVLAAVALAGCDDSSSSNSSSASDQQVIAQLVNNKQAEAQPNAHGSQVPHALNLEALVQSTATAEPPAKQVVPVPSLPVADKSTPRERYVLVNSGNQLMFQYLALMGGPIDYEKVAEMYSRDYTRTTDAFRKNDLLNSLKPKIDQEVARAKASPYLKVEVDASLDKYDFNEKGFPVTSSIWGSGSYRYFSDNSRYKSSFTNGGQFKFIHPANEDDARKIETLRSRSERLSLMVYCFAQDADPSIEGVNTQIVTMELVDRKGTVLAKAE